MPNPKNSTPPEVRPEVPTMKQRLVTRFFNWLDPILSRSSKLWMYLLECVGVLAVVVLLSFAVAGFTMIVWYDRDRGKELVEAVVSSANSLQVLIVGVTGALPAIIGLLRQKNKDKGCSTSPGSSTPS